MICFQCRNEIDKPRNSSSYWVSNYYCTICREEFTVWGQIRLGDYVVEHRDYRIYCDMKTNRSAIQRVYVEIEGDGSIMYRWHTILELPVIPQNLNAETIEQKLKTILLFS